VEHHLAAFAVYLWYQISSNSIIVSKMQHADIPIMRHFMHFILFILKFYPFAFTQYTRFLQHANYFNFIAIDTLQNKKNTKKQMSTDSRLLTVSRMHRRTFNPYPSCIYKCNYKFSHSCTVYGPAQPHDPSQTCTICVIELICFTGKIYVVGGFNGVDYLDSVEVYDPEINQWTSISPMLSRRSGMSCIAFHGNLYVIGKNLRDCE
jgi:hypothetical protein